MGVETPPFRIALATVAERQYFAAKGKVEGDVGTAELGTAVWAFNDDGKPVARNARNVTLAVDERKSKTVRNPAVIFTQTINLPQGRNYCIWPCGTR